MPLVCLNGCFPSAAVLATVQSTSLLLVSSLALQERGKGLGEVGLRRSGPIVTCGF